MAKKKNDRVDANKIADCLRCDFLPECYVAATEISERRRTLRYRKAERIYLSRPLILGTLFGLCGVLLPPASSCSMTLTAISSSSLEVQFAKKPS
jgi:hypothetical protein